jgi:hypothetical protein
MSFGSPTGGAGWSQLNVWVHMVPYQSRDPVDTSLETTLSKCIWSRQVLCTLLVITINVPVVFMARYIMVLRGATSLRGALEGVGTENRDFFGP